MKTIRNIIAALTGNRAPAIPADRIRSAVHPHRSSLQFAGHDLRGHVGPIRR